MKSFFTGLAFAAILFGAAVIFWVNIHPDGKCREWNGGAAAGNVTSSAVAACK